MIYLTDHRPEKKSDECSETLLWLYLFDDRIISSVKLVHISCITNLFVSAPNLPHSSVCFWLKQPKLVKKVMSIQVSAKRRLGTLPVVHRASCVRSWSVFSVLTHLIHRSTNLHRNKFVAHSHSNTGSEMKMYSRQQHIESWTTEGRG